MPPVQRSPLKQIPTDEAKKRVIVSIAKGLKVAEAMERVGRKEETYRDWRKLDSKFKAEIDRLRHAVQVARQEDIDLPDFPEFCETYLKQPLHPHQLRMWDMLEGRPPRDLLQAFRYEPGAGGWESGCYGAPAGRHIINLPPGHAKTTTISINYCTWLIHKNPNIKIIVVCKDMGLAEQILGAVKFRLTSPVFHEMHARFAPQGGWQDPDQSWTATRIYVQGKNDGEKDPTMQALGIGGRIYGARSDVIILDDAVTLANVSEHAKQRRWLEQEVESRLDGKGLLAILGTRIAPVDLYSELRDVFDWDEQRVYSYLGMPALIDEADGKPENWTVLWPERMPGRVLARVRRDEATWALVYQQQDVAEDAAFNSKAVDASINTLRFPGAMKDGAMGHRPGGRNGLYVVGGWDPAAAGGTAMVVSGLDRHRQKRYILDGFFRINCSVAAWRNEIKRLTDLHGINEWVIERNGVQGILANDPDLQAYLRARGCRITPHFTSGQKRDPDIGVMSMAPLFLTCGEAPSSNTGGHWRKTPDRALIELPNPKQNPWVAELINELIIWQPEGNKQKQRTDMVMALWFTEIAFQRILGFGQNRQHHISNPWLSPARRAQQKVINITELREARMAEAAS